MTIRVTVVNLSSNEGTVLVGVRNGSQYSQITLPRAQWEFLRLGDELDLTVSLVVRLDGP